jgi:diguanylate cyclase (GGDEF)-like protein/PAS domain S-box-containing protein
MAITLPLIHNVALLLALTFIYGLVQPRIDKFSVRIQIAVRGAFFGSFAVAVMLSPVELAPGVLLDGRTMILAIAGAFGGWQVVLVALLIALPAHLLMAGIGIVSGTGMMLTSAVLGVMLHHRFRNRLNMLGEMLLLGLLIGIQRLIWLFVLPAEIASMTFSASVFPVLLVYPVGTALLGTLLTHQQQQMRMNETLRVSDLAFRTSLSGVVITDKSGHITSVNPAALRMFGYVHVSELEGKPYTTLLNNAPEQLEAGSGSKTTTRLTFEYMGLRANDKTFPITVAVAPVKDEHEQFLGFVLTINDQTEYKLKEELLTESTQMLVQFAESLKQVHRLNTTEYKTLTERFNACLEVGTQTLGMTTGVLSQIEGDIFRICAVKSDLPDFEPGMEFDLSQTYCVVVANRQHTVSYECVGNMPEMLNHPVYLEFGFESYICAPLFVNDSLYGTLSFFSEQPRQFEQHEIEGLELLAASICHALTRKADEEARRESEERYRSIVKVMSNGIVLQYADGTIRASNESAERILGMTTEQMTGTTSIDPRWRSIHEDGSPFPGEDHPAMVTLRTGEPQSNVMMGVHKPDGELTWISINSQPMTRPNETKPYAVATSFEDITHRKQIELKLTERVYQLQMLHRAEAQLNEQLNVEHVLRTGLQIALQTSDAEDGFIGMIEQGELALLQAVGSYSTQVLTPRFVEALLQRDASLVYDRACVTLLPFTGAHAQILFPLISHNKLIGILNLETSRPERFTQNAFETIKLIAPRLAIALQNAQFSETTRQQLVELQALHRQVEYQAEHDGLTGLLNRHAFEQAFVRQAKDAPMAVLYIDLDRFKVINDTFGHGVGDRYLSHIAQQISLAANDQGIAARLGGDEFAIVFTQAAMDAEERAKMLLETLNNPFYLEGHEFHASASIGISFYPQDGQDLQTLLRKADGALYDCKNRGRNAYSVYRTYPEAEETKQLSLEHELHHALERGELYLHYQPQYALDTDVMIGVEALLRWKHPQFGSVSPVEFIPLAEKSGLIVPIGKWVLEEACRQCYIWHQRGYGDLRAAVNISVIQFSRDDFICTVKEALEKSGLPPHSLELELTESMLLDSGRVTMEKLNALKVLGVHLSIDDFGTGYSSLSYLQHLPIDQLKIDRSFIQHIDHEGSGQVITRTIISLAHHLGMEVIAEGIETESQKEFLRQLGCEIIQGYLLSPPRPADQIETLLTQFATVTH